MIAKSIDIIKSSSFIKLFLIIETFTRIALGIYGLNFSQISVDELPQILIYGFVNDLIFLIYALPVVFILFSGLSRFRKYHPINLLFSSLISLVLILVSCSELIFWDEFGTRFNFIAVDYLLYTHEIIGTLRESLPIFKLAAIIVIASIIIGYFVTKKNSLRPVLYADYLKLSTILIILSFLLFHYFNPNQTTSYNNRFASDLSKSGPYEFFSAVYNNSLNFNKFYQTLPSQDALKVIKDDILQDNQKFISDDDYSRLIMKDSSRQSSKYNIVMIVVESLSAEFMTSFGNNPNNITPNLDKLATEGIFFTNFYATGTRTVRGLEALVLSIPPTPGTSIIRRPNNSNLFNLGSVFKSIGYNVNFLYGGYSYFDNLNQFFSTNDFEVIDRSNIDSNKIDSANIWGVADENLFTKSLEVANEKFQTGKPFFQLIMTTSNHRPYTYPENRIDISPGTSRKGAVKYTDYAIGKFIDEAKSQDWFDQTIFVIVADHCASSAGKTHLPINKYHIPLIIYAPKIVKPKVISELASQIDVAPTILGLINLEYKSKFIGNDLLISSPNRAFISTYQLLGFMENNELIILAPNQKISSYKFENDAENSKLLMSNDEKKVSKVISYYQMSYEMFINNKLKNFLK